MAFLPESIWKRRLEAEFEEMKNSNYRFSCNEGRTKYLIELDGAALKMEGSSVKETFQHKVEVELKREFPYPGGIEVTWLNNIFHPNIREDGKVCIQVLNNWNAMQSVKNVADALILLLKHPNPLSPLNKEAGKYFEKLIPKKQASWNGPKIVQ